MLGTNCARGTMFLSPQRTWKTPHPSAVGWVQGMVCLMQHEVLGGAQHLCKVLWGLTLNAAAAHAQAAGIRLQRGFAGELVPCQVPAEQRRTISSQGCPSLGDGMLMEVPKESPPCSYVLWEEEIQYWDRGWFISSGTTRSYLASITMFSLEKRYVRN